MIQYAVECAVVITTALHSQADLYTVYIQKAGGRPEESSSVSDHTHSLRSFHNVNSDLSGTFLGFEGNFIYLYILSYISTYRLTCLRPVAAGTSSSTSRNPVQGLSGIRRMDGATYILYTCNQNTSSSVSKKESRVKVQQEETSRL